MAQQVLHSVTLIHNMITGQKDNTTIYVKTRWSYAPFKFLINGGIMCHDGGTKRPLEKMICAMSQFEKYLPTSVFMQLYSYKFINTIAVGRYTKCIIVRV